MNPDPEPSSSDSSSSSDSDSRARKKKRTKKKKCRKHQKYYSSDPSLRDDSDLSNGIHYRRKRRKDKKHWEKDPIRICANLTAKLLMTAYRKSVVSIGKMTHPNHLQVMILIRPMTVIIDVNNAKIRNI